MQTIVESKQHIEKLWGKQKVREDETYRLMRYVLRVEHEGKVLLHNVVTGQLVALNLDEAKALDKLPMSYHPIIRQLVAEHFLVPEGYDEHQQVVKLRYVLWKMEDALASEDVTYYTILPTTACNARCWYCFEQGIKTASMTDKTADDVVDFIARKCGGKPIKIRWFGGEPTIVADKIDRISQGLRDRGIIYSSVVTTNGYAFDEEMVKKAKQLWNATQVTISIDGTEDNYNRIKAFPSAIGSPYQRMMRNVELLLANKINVAIRMNFDKETWSDYPKLLEETRVKFHNHPHLMVYPHQINVDMPADKWSVMENWLNKKNEELYELATEFGNYRRKIELPSLLFTICEAGNKNNATILPGGQLACCPEQLDESQIKGTIWDGITNTELVDSWMRFADHLRCRDCSLFPECARVANCNSKDRCSDKTGRIHRFEKLMVKLYLNTLVDH